MKKETNHKKNTIIFGILMAGGLLLRLLLGYFYPPYPETMGDWSERIFRVGFADFYSPEVQWPYPPVYLYILWLLQAIMHLFSVTDPQMRELIIELPPILCDLGAAALLWHCGRELLDERKALLVCALWLFNPAAIHNSCMWGQTDVCFSLTIALMCVAFSKEKLWQGFLFFGISLLIKQQSLCFAPILITAVVEQVFLKNFSVKRTLRVLCQGLAVIAGMVLISLPFGLKEMLKQYLSVQGGMPYASVDAFNFWALCGRNWAPLDSTLLGISCKTWGSLAIVGITLLCFFLAWRLRGKLWKYPLMAAVLILPVFCFGTGMHERYMLSGLLFLLLARVYAPKAPIMVLYFIFTLLQLINTVAVYQYNLASFPLPKEVLSPIVSLGVVLSTLALYVVTYFCYLRKKKE